MRVAAQVVLTEEQRSELSAYARRRSVALRLVERANIILQAAEGKQDQEIATALQLGRHTVARWRARFLQHGIAGIEKDAPRPGRTRAIDPEEIIRKTTQEKPAQATHWTTRTLARVLGISEATVRRAWHAHGLKPHLVDTFKVSRDPQFVEKLEDIVGLYLNPPQQAIVFSVDEKSQIQALDRTQPGCSGISEWDAAKEASDDRSVSASARHASTAKPVAWVRLETRRSRCSELAALPGSATCERRTSLKASRPARDPVNRHTRVSSSRS